MFYSLEYMMDQTHQIDVNFEKSKPCIELEYISKRHTLEYSDIYLFSKELEKRANQPI